MKYISLLSAFLCLSLIFPSQVEGQDEIQGLTYESLLPDFNQFTPEAASLGKFGSIGLSEYSGTPDISIPLFTVKSGNLSLPIRLYYDASGIKVEQEATYVGLGWNLSCGGNITHIVCGKDDYVGDPYNSEQTYLHIMDSLLFWPCSDRLDSPHGTESEQQLYPLTKPIDIQLQWLLFGNKGLVCRFKGGRKDSLVGYLMDEVAKGYHIPDIFQASFCGHHVSFIFDPITSDPVIIGDEGNKYKIEYIRTHVYPDEFTITDDQGIKYRFISFCEYYGRKDSYFLESITDINGQDCIKFIYQQPDLSMIGHYTFFQSVGAACKDGFSIIIGKAEEAYFKEHNNLLGADTYAMKKIYPCRIETKQETVSFFYEDREDVQNGKRIKNIGVSSKNGSALSHYINFKYDYFDEHSLSSRFTDIVGTCVDVNPTKRLKLTGVTIDGMEYGFGYDETHPLPYRTSLSQDYWGYYNGIDNKKKFCATPRYKYTDQGLEEIPYVGKANRYSSEEYCKTGVLNRIDYPTGGYTQFEYELNHFDNSNGFYYMDAANYRFETNFWHTTLLGSTHVIGIAPENDDVYFDTFTLNEEKDVKVKYGLHSSYSPASYVRLLDSNNVILLRYITTDMDDISGDTILHLPAGTYTLESFSTKQQQGSNTPFASISAELVELRKDPVNSAADESGRSIGGGLRIKSVRNYDGSDNRFLGGTEYKYKEGKLLIPTTYTRQMQADETIARTIDDPFHPLVIFEIYHSNCYFATSQASFPAICSLGSPNVGYSEVTKQEIEQDGSLGKKTITHFNNSWYMLVEHYNFFYHANHGLNGKPSESVIISQKGDTLSKTRYVYRNKVGKRVIFPQCQAQFFWGNYLDHTSYLLSACAAANVWHYLTQKTETPYADGLPMKPMVTQYTYKSDNYRASTVRKSQGQQVSVDRYFYPSDRMVQGDSLLAGKHCIGRLTGTKQYLNGVLTGGAGIDFVQNDSFPVVSAFRTILPDSTSVQKLNVLRHDESGNILEYVTRNGTHTTLLWSYNRQYPVMQIVNATYDQVSAASGAVSSLGTKSTLTVSELRSLHTAISVLPDVQVSAYAYDKWYGVSDIINPQGKLYHYGKDSHGRLSEILEDSQSGPVLQHFFYHYRNE